MNRIALPALDGRTALGFLAALGTLRLLTDQVSDDCRLSWSPEDATALLNSATFADVEQVAAALSDVVRGLATDQVIPGLPAGLPPPGEAPDRLRLTRSELRRLVKQLRSEGDVAAIDGWLASLVTDLSVDGQGRAAITLFAAPSGKQSMRTMLEKPLRLMRASPAFLLEALTHWRRVPGYTGEYLDHRVLFDAADAPDGRPSERGVPGATWLALMAYPLLRTTSADGSGPVSTGWARESGRLVFHWPLWRPALDVAAVRVLLEHPVVVGPAGDKSTTARAQQAALGIFFVGRAGRRRIEGRNFAGVLAPAALG